MLRSSRIGIVAWCLALAAATALAEDEQPEAVAQLQGRWVRRQNTPQGVVTLVKEHQGNATTLTATDAAGTVLYAHTSQFSIESLGKVRVFTFVNRTVTAGPQMGQVEKGPISYIYRVHEGRFLEVRGVLEDDPSRPAMIVWERP